MCASGDTLLTYCSTSQTLGQFTFSERQHWELEGQSEMFSCHEIIATGNDTCISRCDYVKEVLASTSPHFENHYNQSGVS